MLGIGIGNGEAISYVFGPGGVSPRVPALPISFPTAYHPWWRPEESFWNQRRPHDGRRNRQPVPEA